jgi:autotransporter adhesin
VTTIDIATTAHEKKTMAKTLLALPKSQIATMEELNAEVKALVAEGKKLKGNHGAAKRHEGALAGALRRMTESEMDALVSKVTAIENGTTGAIDSNVDALAMSWRARLLSGTEATTASSDDATACLGEIFDALATAEANETSAPLSFTRQELKVALDAATKESRARALAIAEFNASLDKEMEVLAYGETNEEVLRETRAFIAQKLKSGGGASATPSRSPPRAKSSKRLLGMLRDVAAVVVAA